MSKLRHHAARTNGRMTTMRHSLTAGEAATKCVYAHAMQYLKTACA